VSCGGSGVGGIGWWLRLGSRGGDQRSPVLMLCLVHHFVYVEGVGDLVGCEEFEFIKGLPWEDAVLWSSWQ